MDQTGRKIPAGTGKPLMIGLLVVVLLGLVTAWMQRSRDRDVDAAGPASAADAAALGQQGTAVGNRAPAGAAGTPIDAPGTRSMEGALEQSMARRERMRSGQAEQNAVFERQALAAFRTETVDAPWAASKESELGKVASAAAGADGGIQPDALDVDCKRTMCRVNATFANSSAAQDWTLLYMSSVGSALPRSIISSRNNPDGSTTVEIHGRAR